MATVRKSKKTTARRKPASRSAAPARKLAAPKRAARTVELARPSGNGKLDAKAALSQKERAQVESELMMLRAELQEAPEMTGDEVDLNVYEREKTLGLVTAYERRLEELDAALKAAQRGQYGICERCGNPIDPERLKIFPETRLCVNCKNEVEKEQRRLRQ